MFQFLACSMITILPDYLFRRFGEGKRIGHEITFFSVWYEIDYGITDCAILTLSIITAVFYLHPSVIEARSFFRTVSILPKTPDRIEEVFVTNNHAVKAGDPIFRMDGAQQQSALETAERQVEEIDAQILAAAADLTADQTQVEQVRAELEEAERELVRTKELTERRSSAVSVQELDRRRARAEAANAALAAAQAVQANVDSVLPARKANAEVAVRQAEVELDLTIVYAGVDGTVEQFGLQPGITCLRFSARRGSSCRMIWDPTG